MQKNNIINLFIFIFLVTVFSNITVRFSYAQTIPSTADSSRIDKELQKSTIIQKDKADFRTKEQKTPKTTIPKGAEKYKFTLSNIIINDMSVYNDKDIKDLYKNLIGKQVSFVDILELSDKLTAKYRNDGYILSRVIVPPQKITNGVVSLTAIEGFVADISITGIKGKNTYLIKKYLEPVKLSKPLEMKVLEKALLLINSLNGIKVRNILTPSDNIVGASNLKIIIEEEKSFSGYLKIDNRGSKYLGPMQVSTFINYDNLFGRYENFYLQFVTTPPFDNRELDYISTSYSENFGKYGTKIGLRGSVSSTNLGYDLSEFAVKSISKNLSFFISQPIIKTRINNLSTTFSFNIANTRRKDNLSTNKIIDKIRTIRLSIDGNYTDKFSGITYGNISFSHGLDILGNTKTGTANMTRTRGVSDFFKINAEINRIQKISNNLQLIAGVTGQKSANILLSAEEFGIGGALYGKAYDSSEITGEDGIASKLELHLINPYKLKHIDNYRLYSWYDIGKVWDRDSNIVKDKQKSLASTGLGISSDINKNIFFNLEYTVPLTRQVGIEKNNKPRIFANFTVKF